MSKSDIAIIAIDGIALQPAPIMMYNTVIADIIDGQIIVPDNVHIITGGLVKGNGNLIGTKGNTRLGDVGDEFVAIVRDVSTALVDAELSAEDNGVLTSVNKQWASSANYQRTVAITKPTKKPLFLHNIPMMHPSKILCLCHRISAWRCVS